MLPHRLARHLPFTLAALAAMALVIANDAGAATATRTIRVEKVIVDNYGIAPPSTFSGTITNAGEGGGTATWSVSSTNPVQDFTVPTNLEHVVTENAPPAWSGWALGGYKQVSRHDDWCDIKGFNSNTGSFSVPPGTGNPKICVRNTFTGGVLHIGLVTASGGSAGLSGVTGSIARAGTTLTPWTAAPGAFAPPVGLAAGNYDLPPPALPAGWSIVGWATGGYQGSPACPTSPASYGATAGSAAITTGQRTVVCLMVAFAPPPPSTATLYVAALRDPAPGVPPDDGLAYAGDIRDAGGTTVAGWGPVGFGTFDRRELAPGDYTVTAPGAGGWLPDGLAPGSLADGTPTCPGDGTAYASFNISEGAAVHLDAGATAVVCIRYTRAAAFPSVTMAKHPGGAADGLARWQLTLTNSEALDLPVALHTDATMFLGVAGGGCDDADLADGQLRCTLPARGTLVVTVASPLVAPACAERTINATASAALLPPARPAATPFGGTLGGTPQTAYIVSADPTACPPPTVTKRPIAAETVTDPAAVAWAVTIASPAIPRTIVISDPTARLLADPATGAPYAATGEVNCAAASDGVAAVDAALRAPAGLGCTLDAGASLVLVVAPAAPVTAGCAARDVTNTVTVTFDRGDGVAATVTGSSTITLAGDPAACPVTRTILAAFEGAPPPGEAAGPPFAFDPAPGGSPADRCDTPTLLPGALRWACTLPPGWQGTIVAAAPAGWEPCGTVDADPPVDIAFRFCRRVAFEVRVVVTNGDAGPARFAFTLTPTGAPASIPGEAAVGSPAHLADVPLAAGYRFDAAERFGFRRLGLGFPGDGSAACPAAPDLPLAALPAELPAVPPGESRRLCLYYERVTPVVVEKSAVPATVGPGGAFRWVIDVEVAGAALPSPLTLTDTLPAPFTHGPLEGDLASRCRREGDALACELPAGTPPGTYRLAIPVVVPADDFAACGEHTNTVDVAGAGLEAGSESATVTVDCPLAATLHVRSVVAYDPAAAQRFAARLKGPGLAPGGEPLAFGPGGLAARTGLAAGTFAVEATPPPGYTLRGWATGSLLGGEPTCPASPAREGAAAPVVALAPASPVAVLCFYADPRVTVRVEKVLNVLGFERPGEGWEFTLEGCGVPARAGTTDAAGVVTFADLPPAVGCSYTVTETVQPGWVPAQASQAVQPTDPGQPLTVRFLNIRAFELPCADPNDARCAPPSLPAASPNPAPPAPLVTAPPPAPAAPPPAPATPPLPPASGIGTPPASEAGSSASIMDPTPRAPAAGTGAPPGSSAAGLLARCGGFLALAAGGGAVIALRRRR